MDDGVQITIVVQLFEKKKKETLPDFERKNDDNVCE